MANQLAETEKTLAFPQVWNLIVNFSFVIGCVVSSSRSLAEILI